MDFALAVLLATGLSIATIIVSLFGPTQPLIASFAWVLAASFVVNGLMLLEVASCERSPDSMLQAVPNVSVSEVADVVRVAVAPVFLLSGIGAFLNVCASRLSRIVDR